MNTDENPYRKPRFPPYPPITEEEYTFFMPIPPEYQSQDRPSKAERKLLKQQWKQEKKSTEQEQSSQEYSDSEPQSEPESDSDSSSESQSDNGNPLSRGRNPHSLPRAPRKKNPFNRPKYSIPPCMEPQYRRVEQQSVEVLPAAEDEMDEDLAKILLVHNYVHTAPLDEGMIYSSQITQLLTSEDFLSSHTLQQIQERIDSLVIPNAPTRQQQINMQQARGDFVYVSQAEAWDLEQQVRRLFAECGIKLE